MSFSIKLQEINLYLCEEYKTEREAHGPDRTERKSYEGRNKCKNVIKEEIYVLSKVNSCEISALQTLVNLRLRNVPYMVLLAFQAVFTMPQRIMSPITQ